MNYIMDYWNIRINNWKNNLILSAPHWYKHFRNNEIRWRELKTTEIVETISNDLDVFSIYKTCDDDKDANWDKKCEYKSLLKWTIQNNNIKFLFDIHWMNSNWNQDICIGINSWQNIHWREDILEKIIQIFKEEWFANIGIDIPFKASYENCISRYIAKECNIPTFQIEINLKYRSDQFDEYKKYNNLINSLKKIINYILTHEK